MTHKKYKKSQLLQMIFNLRQARKYRSTLRRMESQRLEIQVLKRILISNFINTLTRILFKTKIMVQTKLIKVLKFKKII